MNNSNKRRRDPSVARTVLIVGGLLTLLMCGTGGFALYNFVDFIPASRDLPAATKAYRDAGFYWTASEFAPNPPVKDADNAALLFKKAEQEANWERAPALDLSAIETAEGRDKVVKTLKPYEASLETAKLASLKPRLDFHRDWDEGAFILFPEFATFKGIVKSLSARALVEAGQGNSKAAVDDLEAAQRLAALLPQDSSLIAMLVQIACNAIVDNAVARCAAIEASRPDQLEQLLAVVDRRKTRPNFIEALRMEAYISLATLRNFRARDVMRMGEPEAKLPPLDRSKLQRDGYPKGISNRAFLTRILQTWTEMGQPMKKYKNDPRSLGKALDVEANRLNEEKRASFLLAKVVFPVFTQAGLAVVKSEAQGACTKALLKAMIIHAKTGAFPTRISEIRGAGLDPFNGQPLHVRLKDNGIRIYSVGPDGVDDGGTDRRELRSDVSGKGWDVVAAYPPIKSGRK